MVLVSITRHHCGILLPAQMLEIQWVGQLFINMLKLIVLPLISARVSAITSIGGMKKLGSVVFIQLSMCY